MENRADMLALWIETKQVEDEARKRRIELESHLYDVIESKDEGSKTTTVDGFKVTITNRTNYRLDLEKWEDIAKTIPENMQPVKTKIEIDGKKYQSLPDEYFDIVADAVTATPAKPGFKVVKDA